MKKLLLLAVLAAVLVPATSGAVTFNNMSGTARMRVVATTLSGSTLLRQIMNFTSGSDTGILTAVSGQSGALFLEDRLTFTGTGNDAELLVQGNIISLSSNRATGPAAFTLHSPAEIPSAGRVVRLDVAGAVQASIARNAGTRGALRMSFQPSSVAFNVYSSGSLVGTQNFGSAAVRVPVLVKTFTNLSSASLPPFTNLNSGM